MAEIRLRNPRIFTSLRRVMKGEQLILSLLALVVGTLVGAVAIVFREALLLIQKLGFGSSDEAVHYFLQNLPAWHLVLVPTLGGLIIGVFVYRFMPERRVLGVADVIDAAAFHDGRMSVSSGIKAALVNVVSLGCGSSLGREGPVVHIGATIGSWLTRILHLRRSAARTLLGCGVASAVAASFNAPLAGALFAHEVALGYYALTAFAPIVLASVSGTILTRLYFGHDISFLIPAHEIASFLEFPAFALLGGCAGILSIVVVRSVGFTQQFIRSTGLPVWARPALAGLAVGTMAIGYPQIVGVGYGAINDALYEVYSWSLLSQLLVVKAVLVVLCLSFGFGGGVFSPALFLGAMLGGAFGLTATAVLPHLSSGHGAYTLVGMGAMAAAVLGAPISTTLIIFELTGDYELTIAVMVASVIASMIADQGQGGSFFGWQLRQRGLSHRWGREVNLLRSLKVVDVMSKQFATVLPDEPLSRLREKLINAPYGELFVLDVNGKLVGTITLADLRHAAFDPNIGDDVTATQLARVEPPSVCREDSIEHAIRLMEQTGDEHLPVVANNDDKLMIGFVHEKDAMMAYNRALLELHSEERGDAPPKLF
ncbi:chloride channel protein [uncultured Thalassospira sp.]|uniref:chloride channel protein n=1 Tax=uncultured Thalassospira sp. TaxID=404382 RepID=UPI0030DBDB83